MEFVIFSFLVKNSRAWEESGTAERAARGTVAGDGLHQAHKPTYSNGGRGAAIGAADAHLAVEDGQGVRPVAVRVGLQRRWVQAGGTGGPVPAQWRKYPQ